MANRPSVLFVCMSNICRSPLAEAAFRAAADRAGLEIAADSAGTSGWHAGDPPDVRAQAEALRHGINISCHRARQVDLGDFRRSAHILALDSENLADLKALAPRDATASLELLLDHVDGRQGHSVIDPYFGNVDGFERTWHEVSAAAEGLVIALLRKS